MTLLIFGNDGKDEHARHCAEEQDAVLGARGLLVLLALCMRAAS
jgi:hypothetical protein